jgi:epsilon-lactone hydrolase
MTAILLTLLAIVAVIWAVTAFWLQGPDLSAYDPAAAPRSGDLAPPSPEHLAVVASLAGVTGIIRDTPRHQQTAVLRRYMDTMFDSDTLTAQITPVDAGGVAAEWVQASGVDGNRRLLYIHGGAFCMGSPRSHRRLTSQFSELANAAVLSIDYRLMPEHPRLAGIEDCRAAYRWMLDNGPEGAGAASAVFVAGDSAGGNLTLSLLAWIRDQGLRAPNAAVALSPATDGSLGSPSLGSNLATDPMLGPLFKALAGIPRPVLLWGAWLQTHVRPCDPVVSPVFGDLAGLPPLLVQASEMEMLRDDSRRYVAKAQAAGSPVVLQTWPHMIHVWQIFHRELPEARQALAEIGKFLQARS